MKTIEDYVTDMYEEKDTGDTVAKFMFSDDGGLKKFSVPGADDVDFQVAVMGRDRDTLAFPTRIERAVLKRDTNGGVHVFLIVRAEHDEVADEV